MGGHGARHAGPWVCLALRRCRCVSRHRAARPMPTHISNRARRTGGRKPTLDPGNPRPHGLVLTSYRPCMRRLACARASGPRSLKSAPHRGALAREQVNLANTRPRLQNSSRHTPAGGLRAAPGPKKPRAAALLTAPPRLPLGRPLFRGPGRPLSAPWDVPWTPLLGRALALSQGLALPSLAMIIVVSRAPDSSLWAVAPVAPVPPLSRC